MLVESLAFVENREILEARYPKHNPAIEWDRLGRAALGQLAQVAGADADRAGGSTLATQIEKFRHSAGGLTTSPLEKLRQMASASLRVYRWRRRPSAQAHRRLSELDPATAAPLGEVMVRRRL